MATTCAQEFVQVHDASAPIYPASPLVEPLPNGEMWLAWGTNTNTSPNTFRVHVRRIDANGQAIVQNDLVFTPAYGAGGLDGSALLPGGGLALVGNYASKPLLLSLDTSAQMIGAARITASQYDQFRDVVVRADSTLTVTGQTRIGNFPVPWVVRTNAQGVVSASWCDRVDSMAGINTVVIACEDGGALVLGMNWVADSMGMHVHKLDALDQLVWGRYVEAGRLLPSHVEPLPGGGWCVLAEQQLEPGFMTGVPVVFQVGSSGIIGMNRRLWAIPSDSGAYNASSMARWPDGTLTVCTTVDLNGGNVMFRLDSALVAEPTGRYVVANTFAYRFKAIPLADGDVFLHGLAPGQNFITPVFARWDTLSGFPCGSTEVPVFTDSIGHGLDSTFLRVEMPPAVLDISGMIEQDTITWTVTDPCGIGTGGREEAATIEAITLFPNPAQSEVRISGCNGLDEISVHDAQGRVVRRWSTPLPAVLEVGGLTAGLYLVVGRIAGGPRFVGPLVKQ